MAEKSKSPWVWVGCGCAVIAGIGLVLIGAATIFGVMTARSMADPEARHDKALEILSAAAIPSGYEAELAMKVPFFAEIVLLEGGTREFVYMKGLRTKADLGAAFDDDDSFDRELRRAGLKVGRRQRVLARDTLTLGAAQVRYVLYEGDVDFVAAGSQGSFIHDDEDDQEAETSAAVLLRCSTEEEPGLGLWAGPGNVDDPAADQAALADFIEQFGFCGG